MITTHSANGSVRVSVHDRGVGIAPEFVDRLFGRYERFESNQTSEVGEGSDFQFTMPVAAAG